MEAEEIFPIVSVILLAVQAYSVYKINKAKLRLESHLGIMEKSGLTIKPVIEAGPSELIELTNSGVIPIDELEAKIEMSISTKKQSKVLPQLEWQRKTILDPKEVAVIPLHEKLEDFFEQNKMATRKKFEFPVKDSETGEEVTDALSVARLIKPFSLMLEIEVKSNSQKQTKTTKKKFRLTYSFIHEPIPDYEPDYKIAVIEPMGEWKN